MARRSAAGFVLVILAAGCAEAPPPRRPAPLSADLDAWLATEARGGAPAHTASLARPREDDGASRARFASHHLASPPERTPRPEGRSRVDVSFQGADIVSAFQFLADAGRVNLVLQDGLTGKVSATLRGVDPYDALVSLAEANGATVKYDRRIVVVQKR
ncbi:Hypothetical protein A7982_06989 [Minicystis rosea]|nr:Hypothetical protein A7982_06989 [Minicystis rosea]